MNEPLLERITQLERSVKRWRLVSMVLTLLLICAVAIGGIFAVVPATQEPGEFWLFLPWVRARAAREAEEQAIQNELKARQALEALQAERRGVEAAQDREKRAEDAAAKKEP
jgi:hypothetical protein